MLSASSVVAAGDGSISWSIAVSYTHLDVYKRQIEDMAGAYEWADLVICRAGALTIAELAATGVASILVPFPHAVDDHQTANAGFLSQAGAAVLLPQAEMTPEAIGRLRDYPRGQLRTMSEKARALARPEATAAVARMCEEIAK